MSWPVLVGSIFILQAFALGFMAYTIATAVGRLTDPDAIARESMWLRTYVLIALCLLAGSVACFLHYRGWYVVPVACILYSAASFYAFFRKSRIVAFSMEVVDRTYSVKRESFKLGLASLLFAVVAVIYFMVYHL